VTERKGNFEDENLDKGDGEGESGCVEDSRRSKSLKFSGKAQEALAARADAKQ
jgi:hypothetical protein